MCGYELQDVQIQRCAIVEYSREKNPECHREMSNTGIMEVSSVLDDFFFTSRRGRKAHCDTQSRYYGGQKIWSTLRKLYKVVQVPPPAPVGI